MLTRAPIGSDATGGSLIEGPGNASVVSAVTLCVGGFAGSITCALFLQRFVEAARSWLHVDMYGWTPSAKPGRPEGGECQAARAIYKLLSERYG